MDSEPNLSQLVDHFRGPLIGLIASWGASPADAVEVAQEVFAEAYLSRDRFRGDWNDPGAAGAWLRGIASNLHRSRTRPRPRRVEPLGDHDPADGAGGTSGSNPGEERSERVRRALERLRGPWRTVLTMRYVEDCELSEIAGLLGIGVRAVEGRLRRARAELKNLLEQEEAHASQRDEVSG